MNGESRLLVTDEPVEFEKQLVEVEDFRKITNDFRAVYGIYLKWMKETRKITTCDRLDLEMLGFRPIKAKNLPEHCCRCTFKASFLFLDLSYHSQGFVVLDYMWFGKQSSRIVLVLWVIFFIEVKGLLASARYWYKNNSVFALASMAANWSFVSRAFADHFSPMLQHSSIASLKLLSSQIRGFEPTRIVVNELWIVAHFGSELCWIILTSNC